MSSENANELAAKIQQFLSHQIEAGNLTEAAKESLTVAVECIGQAYNIQQRLPASRELLDLYAAHKQQSGGATNNLNAAPNPASIIQGLATSFLSSAAAGGAGGLFGAAPQAATTQASSAPTTEHQPARPSAPRVRKQATEAEKMAADSYKNQGNDYMKQDLLKEAYDCYTKAIEIDENNAIFYSNRAAASSKLGNHEAAIRDCTEAVEIDPTYSKAYGRMALAYASMDEHQKAKDAYVKAVELDPTNESYRNNLKIAEEKLAELAAGGGGAAAAGANAAGGQGNMANMLRSMMTNPEVMRMAMSSLQDPRMQNLFGLGGGQQQQQPTATDGNTASATNAGQQQTGANAGNQQQQPAFNPADLLNLTSRLAGSGNIDLVGAGQQLLSSLQGSNPELVENMRRMMNQAFTPPSNNNANNNNSDRNPPPGYS